MYKNSTAFAVLLSYYSSFFRVGNNLLARGKYAVYVALTAHLGSPPFARGKPVSGKDKIAATGITPACAGNTLKIPHKIRTFLVGFSRFSLTF